MTRRVLLFVRRPGVGWLVAALALAALAVAGTTRGETASSRDVVVAAVEIPAGLRFSRESLDALLTRVEVTEESALAGVLEDPGEAEGAVVAAGLAPGEPLTRSALQGRTDVGLAPLAPGQRAISVTVPAPGPGVGPGSRVDVVVTATAIGAPARVVVPAAELLAIDESDPLSATRTVSLRMSADQALEVASAAGTGAELRLLLRSPVESSGIEVVP